MNRYTGTSVVPWVVATVFALYLASKGGPWLLWLLLVPYLGWNIYKDVKPGPPPPAPRRFTEPGDYRVVLQLPGRKALSVIVQVRRTTGMDLADAQKLVETAPNVVVEGLSQKSAELVVVQLRRAGAKALAAPIGEM